MTEFQKIMKVSKTTIPGLLVLKLPVRNDGRGWFTESWQRDKMMSAGLPDFGPVRSNACFSAAAGTTRGIHAEPWDKYISVATGRVFGAWVDFRAGPTFGAVSTCRLDPSRAVFVPRGVGAGLQTEEPDTAYSLLDSDHHSSDSTSVAVNLGDVSCGIKWPISLQKAIVSRKDRSQPWLSQIQPFGPRKTLVLGAGGQLGRALRTQFAHREGFEFADRADVDLTSGQLNRARRWRDYSTIINAAAFTAVDAAETPEGRRQSWACNVTGLAELARIAADYRITLVQVSSDYVFDGTSDVPYSEDSPLCPLGVYGQTKAAGEQIVRTVPRHYVVRTSWVVGEGRNFVRTMLSLADNGVNPSVVNDQYGRLSFASELARAIRHLIEVAAPYGVYNVTGSGPAQSWADIARRIFTTAGHNPDRVKGVSTEEYLSKANCPTAPRPRNSALDLGKIESTGFVPCGADTSLSAYIAELRPEALPDGNLNPRSFDEH